MQLDFDFRFIVTRNYVNGYGCSVSGTHHVPREVAADRERQRERERKREREREREMK